ncbi:MAG: Na+/H+ antiporter subunit E [Hyphomicrobiales bacterium]|nr:Na+/H+ antiporter subunit E [Hyphomicrobiales bacterium]
MKVVINFGIILTGFWLINSGYFKPLLLGFGFLSVVIVIAITWRMKEKDGEFFPLIMMSLRLPGYLLWMIGQIIKSNMDVIRRIWLGSKSISPTIVTCKAGQKSDAGKVLYANSITMTPGTITMSIHDDILEVHALTRQAAKDLQLGEMDRRVTVLEDV